MFGWVMLGVGVVVGGISLVVGVANEGESSGNAEVLTAVASMALTFIAIPAVLIGLFVLLPVWLGLSHDRSQQGRAAKERRR